MSPEAARPLRRETIILCLVLFAVALALRLFFWKATPDSDWPYSVYLKGDAVIWLEYAHSIRNQQPFELDLPIHPPGTAYLIALLWNGKPSGVPFLKSVWVFLGSLTVVFLYLAALRSFGLSVASLAAGAAAASTGLMILSTSLNNETPYLLLVALSFCFFGNQRHRPGVGRLAIWSVLQGLACLFRVEHFLFYLLMLGFLVLLEWRSAAAGKLRGGARTGLTRLAVSVVFFLLPLIPWHLKAWSAIERFNTRTLSPPREAAVRRVEELLEGMAWGEAALKQREKLPAFVRQTAATFVTATVAYRGGQRVGEEDFRILEEAFGYYPRPLFRFPFVSSYGPLNFYLANHPGAEGGFSRSPLEEPPPLSSAPDRYPPSFIQGLPPERLSFLYPPHLELFNEGYSLGWKWIREHPADYLALALQKLRSFWSGAALGFTGYNLPLGLSGVRPAVDLVVPESAAAALWQLFLLILCILGVAAGWKRLPLYPWLLFLATKVVVTLLFFGYARQGATVIPVVALLFAVAADRWLLGRFPKLSVRAGEALAILLLLGVVAIEAVRLLNKPTIWLDGRAVAAGDPFPAGEHRERRIEVRLAPP